MKPKARELTPPYFPETFHNIAKLKLHMVNNRCANKQPGKTTAPWGDIAEHNRTKEEPHHAEEQNDHDGGTFAMAELLFGGIQVTDQSKGVSWGRTSCVYTKDKDRKLRNHLSVAPRQATIGDVYFPYCEK